MALRTLDDLVESFALFDNWEDRYRYLIDLGQRLEPMDEADRTDDRLVRGCTSRVWMKLWIDDSQVLHFEAYSDAQIVRGLIYILVVVYQGRTLEEVLQVDINEAFEELGLAGHLSPNRRNGFFAMVENIRAAAAA